MDAAFRTLGNIVNDAEKVYLSLFHLTANDDIATIISSVVKGLPGVSAEDKVLANEDVGKKIVLLAYVLLRFRFRMEQRIDLSLFSTLEKLCEILRIFTNKKGVSDRLSLQHNVRRLNEVVCMMSDIDASSMKARYGLGYRYVRLFLLLVLFGSYTNASVVATFVLEQVEVVNSGGNL